MFIILSLSVSLKLNFLPNPLMVRNMYPRFNYKQDVTKEVIKYLSFKHILYLYSKTGSSEQK